MFIRIFCALHGDQEQEFLFLPGNKYEDDFEEEADDREQDRRHIIGLHDNETRVNGKTISTDIVEKEKEQEKQGTIPEYRRVEGYSSEDEDAEGPRSKSIEVTADVHTRKKEELPHKRRRSSSSSSSSASEKDETPRPQTPERKTRSPQPAEVLGSAVVQVHSARSEASVPPKSGRTDRSTTSTTSTTSGSLTTETESTFNSNREPPRQITSPARRRTSSSSSSSSSTLTSDSEDEKYERKKKENKQKLENEKRRKEEEERRKIEAKEREIQRKNQLEEDERKRMELEEDRKRRFDLQRQQSQDRLRQMEEQRKKQDLERQQQMSEEMKAKDEEKQKRQADEERIKRDYVKQLSFIQSQRESESTLSVTDTAVSEEPKVDVEKTPVKEEKRKSSSSSSSSSSETESEDEKKSQFQEAVALFDTEKSNIELSQSPSTSETSSSTSMSETEKEKEETAPAKPMQTISEEAKESRRSSTSSVSSSSSSSSGGEYMINKEAKLGQKKDDEIQAIIDYKKPETEQSVQTTKPESKESETRKSSSSSGSSSESESDEDNKKVTEAVLIEKSSPERKTSSSSETSSRYSRSMSESDMEFRPPKKPQEPAPFGGIEKESTFEKQELKRELDSHSPVLLGSALPQEVEAVVSAQKEESEDSSSDSSSSGSDSSDSEEEGERIPKKGSKQVTSESEPDTMHGGHDPDNVAKSGTSVESYLAKSTVASPMTHFGSILPMIKGSYALDLNGVKLDDSQLTEINNYIAEVENIKSVTLRNCALDDSTFQNVALALQVTQSHPNLLNFSQNQLGAKSLSQLAVAIKNKPSIEIVILNGNPIGNVGCKVLMDALVKTKDPYPFLRRGSGYLTPSEARQQREEGKEVDYDDGTSDTGCNITELDLGDTKISDAGISEISRFLESNRTLVSLNLNGNRQISSSGWERLGQALKKNKTLKTLSLDFTDIGDSGMENLAKGLRVNTGLRSLELECSGLTEKGGGILRDLLKSNTSILELTATPGNDISDSMLEEIRKYLALNNSATSK